MPSSVLPFRPEMTPAGKPPADDTKFWVALSRIPGIGRVRFQALLNKFERLEDAWAAGPTELKSAGLEDHIVRTITESRSEIDPDAEFERLQEAGVVALRCDEPSYPARLKEIHDPPPILYCKGELTDADEWSLAVVGTRRATPYGRQVAEEMSHQLAANGITVVSGLARGIDAIAHKAALEAGGRTIAVLACGLDVVYPPEHKKLAAQIPENGALVSDYPLGTEPRGDYFPRRNRIMSGMAL